MRYQVVETKVFVVEAVDETSAQMATEALQNEMQMTDRSFELAKYGNCSAYGKIISMAEATNIYVA